MPSLLGPCVRVGAFQTKQVAFTAGLFRLCVNVDDCGNDDECNTLVQCTSSTSRALHCIGSSAPRGGHGHGFTCASVFVSVLVAVSSSITVFGNVWNANGEVSLPSGSLR